MAGELGFDTGPYVNLAVFCENAIEDKDGVLTLVRIIDRVTVSASGEDAPEELPPGASINTNLIIGLKPGEARGRQTVQVDIVHPSGERKPGPKVPVHFTSGANNGQNVHLQIGLTLSDAGLYWAEVLVNDRIVTKVPLEVRYQVTPPGVLPA